MKKPDKTRKEHTERKDGSWENSEKARHQEGGEDLQCQKQETIIAQILALSYSCHKTIMKITLNLEEWHLRDYSFCYINDCCSRQLKKKKKKSHHLLLLSFDGQPQPNS